MSLAEWFLHERSRSCRH